MSQVRNAPRFASAKRGLALVCSFTGPTFGKPMALYSPTFGKPMTLCGPTFGKPMLGVGWGLRS